MLQEPLLPRMVQAIEGEEHVEEEHLKLSAELLGKEEVLAPLCLPQQLQVEAQQRRIMAE